MGRRKLVENDELLAVAREAFVEKGIAASTREIARRAGISEAVIYQRHPTKAHLFFAAMVPPALNVEDLLSAPADDLSVLEQLEGIALGMMEYFREVIPILLPLMTHPEFDLEKFAQRHPDSPFGRMHLGLIQYLESQRKRGRIVAKNVEPAALTLFAALHSLAFFERLGVHGGKFKSRRHSRHGPVSLDRTCSQEGTKPLRRHNTSTTLGLHPGYSRRVIRERIAMSDSPRLYDWVERKAANCPACRMNSVLPCGRV